MYLLVFLKFGFLGFLNLLSNVTWSNEPTEIILMNICRNSCASCISKLSNSSCFLMMISRSFVVASSRASHSVVAIKLSTAKRSESSFASKFNSFSRIKKFLSEATKIGRPKRPCKSYNQN